MEGSPSILEDLHLVPMYVDDTVCLRVTLQCPGALSKAHSYIGIIKGCGLAKGEGQKGEQSKFRAFGKCGMDMMAFRKEAE